MLQNFKVQIPNTKFVLESNKTYRIIPKVDPDAPAGFKKRGITKLEHPLNYTNAIVQFNTQSNLWDTGLYPTSPCYKKDKKLGVENVEIFEKYLLPELKETMPEGALNHKAENTYWDSYGFPINQNYTVSTTDSKGFLGLWFAILDQTIAPEEEQKAPQYKQAAYVIIDRVEKSSSQQRVSYEKSKAIASFISSIEKDEKEKQFIVDVLNYVDYPINKNTENSILNSQFQYWIENKHANAKYFNNAFDKLKTEKGREELEIYKKLKDSNHLRKDRAIFYYKDIELGTTIKEGAEKINNNEEYKKQFLLEGE